MSTWPALNFLRYCLSNFVVPDLFGVPQLLLFFLSFFRIRNTLSLFGTCDHLAQKHSAGSCMRSSTIRIQRTFVGRERWLLVQSCVTLLSIHIYIRGIVYHVLSHKSKTGSKWMNVCDVWENVAEHVKFKMFVPPQS